MSAGCDRLADRTDRPKKRSRYFIVSPGSRATRELRLGRRRCRPARKVSLPETCSSQNFPLRSGRSPRRGTAYRDGNASCTCEGFAATRLRAMELITILNRCYRFRGLCTSTLTSAPTKRAAKWPYGGARVRLQSARVAIWRRAVTTNSPNGALSSSPWGILAFFCTLYGVDCSRSGVVAVEKSPGATANAH